MAEEAAQRSRQGSVATSSSDFILDVESLEGSHISESCSNSIENESDRKAKSEIGGDSDDEKEEEKDTEELRALDIPSRLTGHSGLCFPLLKKGATLWCLFLTEAKGTLGVATLSNYTLTAEV
ncbi:hypothetical protein BGZ82_008995 [Podila clonocystis]|nr:hypothetical protein BGZ82_008995 [Podila clonocystis]